MVGRKTTGTVTIEIKIENKAKKTAKKNLTGMLS